MRELEHLDIELSGSNLIEASAGTGKTYAIACLYLRLLTERELTPEQILVVTFTEAATEELRGRIRGRIREALEVFSGAPTDDPFLRGLSENLNGRGPGRVRSMNLLDRAITSFDTASIFTIHGFCLRALQENAFESGSLYDTGLVTDPSAMLQEVVDDFWRISFFGDQTPLLDFALDRGCSPESFAAFARKMVDIPKMKILPDLGSLDRALLDRECRESFDRVRELWKECREEVTAILEEDKGLSRGAGAYRHDLLPGLFEGMDSFVAADNPFGLFPGFGRFCASGILAGKKPKGAAPSHRFFDACESLMKNVEQRLLLLKWELVEFCGERLPLRKREANIRFFSDLLNDLSAALHGESGDGLAECLRGRYRAALIDEFQDTDPVQYDIFRKIYARPDTPLFVIGDPKQAIYSFRGADIFAYMEASSRIERERRFTLTSNWRSAPGLLDAFNAVFGNGGKPFIYDGIAYHPVRSGKPEAGRVLTVEGTDGAPLQVWTLPPGDGGEPLTVGRAAEAVQGSVAAEIARLLRDGGGIRARLEGKPVAPGDIAVIVRSHRQAGLIQDALRELGIPSVMRSDASIFATGEARELCLLLGALADPGREWKVRAALATGIMGLSGNDLAALLDREEAWEERLERFRDYHRLWLERGFMVMSLMLLAREGVRGRLLRRPDGERRLTNVLHCFEVIHQAAHGGRLGMEGLLSWFEGKVAAGETAEEYQIRLETDEKAVKIVTVHVSKGLEYPIVFCPFMWGGIRTDDDVVTFHEGFGMVRDFGSDDLDSHRALAEKESLAESLRLLYVALTRAKYRCYLVAGKVSTNSARSRPETSPLSYLFHAPEEIRTADDLVARLVVEVRKLGAPDMERQLRELAGRGHGAISVREMPTAAGGAAGPPPVEDGQPLVCRAFTGAIDRDWRVASFTSFAQRDATAVELPDRDGTGPEGPVSGSAGVGDEPRGMNIFSFPRGVQAGIFLHGLFEELEFPDAGPDRIRDFVAGKLNKHGYAPEWLPHLCAMVGNVLSTPLPSASGTFSLSSLRKGSWVTELEFFFPLRFITSDLLRQCLRPWSGCGAGADLLPRLCSSLGFRPVKGMVRGFMDMVFEHGGRYYLVDWKSNHLGNRTEDYGGERLGSAMAKHRYTLQYLLYTVALNRYLSLRAPGYAYETHFGGVLYVFLRGVDPENGGATGIFRDVPPAALIRELTDLLVEAS